MSDAADTPKELTFRQVVDLLVRDPAARPYALTTLGGLAMVFLVMFMNGSDLGGLLVVIFGVAALALRWTAAPPFVVLLIAYFQVFPFGIPDPGSENPYQVRETYFQVTDMVLVMAVLVYLRGQYRVLGLVHQIVPPESGQKRKTDGPTRRPAAHIRPDEVGWLLAGAAALVAAGQVLWWLANALEFVPMADGVPLRWADQTSLTGLRRTPPPGEFRPGQNRFLVMLGGLFFGALLLRLAFGYWRLRVMGPAEGAMVLADTSWAESHRERVRVEKWRVWGRKRAAEQTEAAERAEREREEEEARRRAREEREELERRAAERRRLARRRRPADEDE